MKRRQCNGLIVYFNILRLYDVVEETLTKQKTLVDSLERFKKFKKERAGNSGVSLSGDDGVNENSKILKQIQLDVLQYGEEV